jgi:hypothetical protein
MYRSEVIDGRLADLYRSFLKNKYTTGATWKEPRFWFEGEATNLSAAEVETNIYRTVRFRVP